MVFGEILKKIFGRPFEGATVITYCDKPGIADITGARDFVSRTKAKGIIILFSEPPAEKVLDIAQKYGVRLVPTKLSGKKAVNAFIAAQNDGENYIFVDIERISGRNMSMDPL
ncbi:hypothetical protein J7K99_07560 [bacterium]|nr:hypothetical protein [bacterium]